MARMNPMQEMAGLADRLYAAYGPEMQAALSRNDVVQGYPLDDTEEVNAFGRLALDLDDDDDDGRPIFEKAVVLGGCAAAFYVIGRVFI